MTHLAIGAVALGNLHIRISELTFPNFRRYASRIGADFVPFYERTHPPELVFWEGLRCMRKLLSGYERIIWLDTDVLVRWDAPSGFDLVPPGSFGAWNDIPHYGNQRIELEETYRKLGIPQIPWDGIYLNNGYLVLDRSHTAMTDDPPTYDLGWLADQNYENAKVKHMGYKISLLPDEFLGGLHSRQRLDAAVIHYMGAASGQWDSCIPPGRDLTWLLRKDIARLTAMERTSTKRSLEGQAESP